MIEIDRLPDIQGHRSGGGGVVLTRTEETMEAAGDGIEATCVRAVDPRGRVRLAGFKITSPGKSSSPPPITCVPAESRSA
jgi:hypothetical protein